MRTENHSLQNVLQKQEGVQNTNEEQNFDTKRMVCIMDTVVVRE